MTMKPEAKYSTTKALSEAEVMDMYNGAYEPKKAK